jgi:Rha family phage regulatory protein
MNKNLISNLGFEIKRDEVLVSSRVVAEKLGKQHKHILESIDKIILDSTVETSTLFIESKYKALNGKMNREILFTDEGFLLYIFNIQGYVEFKLEFIKEFKRLQNLLREKQSEEWLKTRKQGKLTRRNETDVIQQLIQYSINLGCKNTKFFYSNYSKMVNKFNGIGTGQREFVDWITLNKIAQSEDIVQKEILKGMEQGLHYSVIYERCKEKIKQYIDLVGTDVKLINGGKLIEE